MSRYEVLCKMLKFECGRHDKLCLSLHRKVLHVLWICLCKGLASDQEMICLQLVTDESTRAGWRHYQKVHDQPDLRRKAGPIKY